MHTRVLKPVKMIVKMVATELMTEVKTGGGGGEI